MRCKRRPQADARLALPAIAMLTGGACMALHWGLGAEFVWVAAGAFFLSVGGGAYLLSVAWAARGVLGTVLRSRGVSLLVLLGVLGTLIWTVCLALRA